MFHKIQLSCILMLFRTVIGTASKLLFLSLLQAILTQVNHVYISIKFSTKNFVLISCIPMPNTLPASLDFFVLFSITLDYEDYKVYIFLHSHN